MAGKKSTNLRTRVNSDIRARDVRLIASNGDQVGIVTLDEALAMAKKESLDLVEISPNSEPPVCRVMNFGKFRFNQKKKQQASKKHQVHVKTKELKFRPGTDVGDYEVKLRNLIGFLERGYKVKITVRFRGREIAHHEIGMSLLQRLEAGVEEIGVVEHRPKFEGRQLTMLIGPKPGVKTKKT